MADGVKAPVPVLDDCAVAALSQAFHASELQGRFSIHTMEKIDRRVSSVRVLCGNDNREAHLLPVEPAPSNLHYCIALPGHW